MYTVTFLYVMLVHCYTSVFARVGMLQLYISVCLSVFFVNSVLWFMSDNDNAICSYVY